MAGINKANGHRFSGLFQAATPEVSPEWRPRPETLGYDLNAALASVFALHAEVPEDAFTAQTLGTERQGNGVLLDGDGLVLTIGYLITEATQITLASISGKVTHADVVGFDQETGFGLVRAHNILDGQPIRRGSAIPLATGETMVVGGHGGLKHALQTRLVSKREFAGYWEYLLDEALFTAPPHPAWSGAALIAPDGRLVGTGSLLVQDALPGPRAIAGNMFVPIDLLEPIIDDIVMMGRTRKPPRPWLGLFATDTSDRLVVAGLVRGGPAHDADIQVGDHVVRVGDRPVTSLAAFFRSIWASGRAGVEIKLTLVRERRTLQVAVRSGNRADYLKLPKRH
jgi:S1-C subfamily serine protease